MDDEIDIELRSAAAIGARLTILSALIRRVFLEGSKDRIEATAELFDLRHWLREMDVLAHATADERGVIDALLGALATDQEDTAAHASESLVTIAWAAGLTDHLPSYDQFAEPTDLLDVIPQPWDDVRSFVASLSPRSDELIAQERERAELWLWRSEIEEDRRAAHGKDEQAIVAAIHETAQEAAAAGLITTDTHRDFLLDGKAFSAHPSDLHEAVSAIAERRLHALNWLCGFGDDWATVPLDV